VKQAAQSYQAVIDLPFGPLGITMLRGSLAGVDYLDGPSRSYRGDEQGLAQVIEAIEDYLDDASSVFDFEIELGGTSLQQRVWQELRTIPAGETLTYGQLAQRIGSGARAVGNACRTNPCPLVVPCHRVVGARGLGGFAGERSGRKLEIKRWLLLHEGGL
jgi:methylated-DNA-[protein]-cysteine S-methyltransferase